MHNIQALQGSPDTSLVWLFLLLLGFLVLVIAAGFLSSRGTRESSVGSKKDQGRGPRENIAQKASTSLGRLKSRSKNKLK